MRVTVNVTAEHIAAGVRSDGEACPIALAVLDAMPGCQAVDVACSTIAVRISRGPFKARTPPFAVEFMVGFDHYCFVEPSVFVLDFEPADPTS